MDLVGTAVIAALLLLVGALLSRQMSGRFKAVEKRMDRLEDRMDGLQGSLDILRSDLTQVALAVGAKPRPTAR